MTTAAERIAGDIDRIKTDISAINDKLKAVAASPSPSQDELNALADNLDAAVDALDGVAGIAAKVAADSGVAAQPDVPAPVAASSAGGGNTPTGN